MMSCKEIKEIVIAARPQEWRTIVESKFDYTVVLKMVDPDGSVAGSLKIWRRLSPTDNALVTTGAAGGAKGSIEDCVKAITEELRPGEEF